jgi:O-methyltransferase
MVNINSLLGYAYCSGEDILELTNTLCKKAIEEDVVGDFCEAGVAMGVHPIIMGQYDRKVHLFDSFEGIPTHGDNDKEFTQAHGKGENDQRKSSGITACSLEEVKKLIASYHTDTSKFIYHKGWFIDTFKDLKLERFAVLRLDGDLYESYKLCFQYLWPKLNKGGYLIIDDYTLSGCRQAIDEFLPEEYHDKFIQLREIAYLQK